MVEIVVAQRMWQRRDTAANWTSINPVLAAGEIGVELGATTAAPQRFKIGNGVTPWNTLAFAGGGSGGSSVWRDGTAVPPNNLGAEGDYYLRTTNGDVYRRGPTEYTVVGNIKGPAGESIKGDPGAPGPPGPSSTTFPTASFDGGLDEILVGSFCDLYIPFGFRIRAVNGVAGLIGNLSMDIRVRDFLAGTPTSLDTICGSSPPTLIGANRYRDDALTDWEVDVPSGSIMRFVITGCDNIRRATFVLEGERT